MCGIAGIFKPGGGRPDKGGLRAMTESMAHRGPDGSGLYIDEHIGLGHRRLAIIDLSEEASQPMSTPDGRFVLSYNGEIYNYRELRRELESEGVLFRSASDTEVLLQALAVWGKDAVNRLNGMFAFAFWDARNKELLLGRDRYGIKPLYYTFVDGDLLVASEGKAFLVAPGFRTGLDAEALLEYFTFQNFFSDRTLIEGIRQFPAGCLAVARAGDSLSRLRIERYWDFNYREPTHPASDAEYEEELDRLFKQAVKRQLVSDVEVGSYLSGGIDSGSISGVAARELPLIKTFTCGFDLRSASGLELSFDEREKAEYMSYLYGTEHYETVLKAGDMQRALPDLVWHLDEPRVGQSYPNHYAAKLASHFVKVVLSGTGGDEIFGGYPWRYYRTATKDSFDEYVDEYYGFWQRLIPNKAIHRVFAPLWSDVSHVWTRDIFSNVFADRDFELTRPEDYVNHSLYFESKTFLQGLLHVEDRLSMAHGLEARVPFLDNDLVDFAMQTPVRLKLGNLGEVARLNENEPGNKSEKFFFKTRDGKLILRKALSRHVPDMVSNGVKQGFSGPDASWFRGESISFVRQTLFSRKAMLYDFMDRDAVLGLVMEHLEGKVNRRLLIWSLLCFELWCRRFLAGEKPAEAVGSAVRA